MSSATVQIADRVKEYAAQTVLVCTTRVRQSHKSTLQWRHSSFIFWFWTVLKTPTLNRSGKYLTALKLKNDIWIMYLYVIINILRHFLQNRKFQLGCPLMWKWSIHIYSMFLFKILNSLYLSTINHIGFLTIVTA